MANPYAKYLTPGASQPRLVIAAPPKEPTPANPTTIANSDSEIANRKLTQTATMRDDFEKRPSVVAYRNSLPIYAQALETEASPAGDTLLTTAYAKLTDPTTGVMRGEAGSVQDSQPWVETVTAKLRNQMDASGMFSERQRQDLRHELAGLMAQRNKAFINDRVDFKHNATKAGLDPESVIGSHPGIRYQDVEAQFLHPGKPTSKADYNGNVIQSGNQPPWAKPNDPNTPPETESGLQRFARDGLGGSDSAPLDVEVTDDRKPGETDEQYAARAKQDAASQQAQTDKARDTTIGAIDATIRGATDTLTLSTSDEITGFMNALGTGDLSKQSINSEIQRQRDIDAADSRVNPYARLAGQFAGGLLLPYAKGGALKMGAQGAALGGAYGFGSGEGGVTDRLPNALSGAASGGVVGAALPIAGGGLSKAYDFVRGGKSQAVKDAATASIPIVNAGQAENVPVSRAMVNPYLANKVTAAEATIAGGPVIRSGLAKTSKAIESRVNDLGAGGTAFTEPSVGGQMIQSASERYIKQSGEVARRQYNRAEKLAGDAKVTPAQSISQIDGVLAKLSETPETNAPEIAFLEKLKNDFGKDLSVGALRRIRTSLRGKISRGDLTFGESEADVLGVMNAASNDIEAGLRSQGKAEAADAFRKADLNYRQRMDFINGTVQKLIGKRNSNVTPEQTLTRFKAMATPNGDEAGLGKMLGVMEPDEARDISATLASTLGRNNKGEFSTALLAGQAKNMPIAARKHLFGEEGAESLSNLVTLAKAHDDIYSKLNHSRSGVATVGNAWRSAIATVAGIVGGAGGGSGVSAAVTGATALAATAAHDVLSARALMSPNLSRWLKNAYSNPSNIQSHIARLSTIAAREPAISGDVISLQNYLAQKFSESPSRAAAAPGQDRNDRRPPPENYGH